MLPVHPFHFGCTSGTQQNNVRPPLSCCPSAHLDLYGRSRVPTMHGSKTSGFGTELIRLISVGSCGTSDMRSALAGPSSKVSQQVTWSPFLKSRDFFGGLSTIADTEEVLALVLPTPSGSSRIPSELHVEKWRACQEANLSQLVCICGFTQMDRDVDAHAHKCSTQI